MGVGQLPIQIKDKPAPQSTFFAFTDIHMKKRSDKNSATSAVAGFAGVVDDAILPPAGVELRSDKEHLIWNQFTRARAREDWRDMDLILLAKIVKMEADIRAAQVELDAVGMMVTLSTAAKWRKAIDVTKMRLFFIIFEPPKCMSEDCGEDNNTAKNTSTSWVFAENNPDQEWCKNDF